MHGNPQITYALIQARQAELRSAAANARRTDAPRRQRTGRLQALLTGCQRAIAPAHAGLPEVEVMPLAGPASAGIARK